MHFIPPQLQRNSFRRTPFGGIRGPFGAPVPLELPRHPGLHRFPRPPPPMVMREPMSSIMQDPGSMYHPRHRLCLPVDSRADGIGMPYPGFVSNPMVPGYSEPMSDPISETMTEPLLSNYGNEVNCSVSSQLPSSIKSAPAIYAVPPMKNLSDNFKYKNNRMLETCTTSNTSVSHTQKTDTYQIRKGPANEEVSSALLSSGGDNASATKKQEKKKKVVRMAGGQIWEDNSLHEWDNDDFRIFCGDIGNDVTDELLTTAFNKYASFMKAKVIRDKRTKKTKGFGFISFKDPQDYIKAMREMNGKYVGSRPIKLSSSTWKSRNLGVVKKKQREKKHLGLL